MKTPKPSPGYHRTSLRSLTRIAVFAALLALIVIPLFSSSLASSSKQALRISQSSAANNVRPTAVRSDQKSAIAGQISSLAAPARATLGSWSSSTFGMLLPLPVPQVTDPIATYSADCTIPKTTFVLGETVCAKAVGQTGFRFAWVDAAGFIEQRTAITTDPQTDTFTLPSTQTSVVNDTTVDNRGEWRVNIITSRGSVRTSAFFTVKDPANAVVDLSITKTLVSDPPVQGGLVQFSVTVTNNGPDDAVNAHFVDDTFSNATLNSVTQTAGPPFTCNPGAVADCSLALFTKGSEARFLLNFTAGTAGGNLQNTATISSATAEQNPVDNSYTTEMIRVGSGGAPPACILECPDNINANADTTESGQRGAHVTYDPPQASGTCGTVTSSPASGSFFAVGTTIVTATSSTGNGSCSFTITVRDEGNPPVITCPSDKTADADSNICSTNVSVGTATTTGGSNVTVTGSRSDGEPMYDCDVNGTNCTRKSTDAPFQTGTTTITWTAYSHDIPGPYASQDEEEAHRQGSASCTQTVTVNDVTPPTINAPPQTASADANCQAPVPDYSNSATDNCACANSDTSEACQGRQRIVVTQDRAAGTMVGLGTYTITLTANDGSSNNDGAGNTSTTTTTFTVNDTTAPTVTAPADSSASADANCRAPVPDYVSGSTASDNCDSTPTLSQSPAAGTLVGAGPHTVTVTATDGSGNSSSDTVVFTVNDTTSPTVTAPADSSASADANCQAPVPDYAAASTASDNCGTPTLTQSPAAGTLVGTGSHTVTVTATDGSGNSSSDTVVFTVNDTTPPVISCPANITRSTDPGMCSANINPGTATATDNCGSATVSGTRSDGQPLNASYPRGTTTITWTATDGSGNSSSCTQTVTVNDTEAPTITTNGQTPLLWPANHQYHTFNVTDFVTGVSDNCDTLSVSQVVIQQVSSDEAENGPGSGNTFNDIVIATNCKSVQLRAERENAGDGRVYTITFKVPDSSGNVGPKTSKVVVPKNLGIPVVDSGPRYTVTGTCP